MEVTLRITSPSAAAGLAHAASCQPQQSISSTGWIILGSSLLGHEGIIKEKLFREKDTHSFEIISLLGTLYSMFIIAVKFDKNMWRRTAKNAWKIGLPGFLVPVSVSLGLVYPIGGLSLQVHKIDVV